MMHLKNVVEGGAEALVEERERKRRTGGAVFQPVDDGAITRKAAS